jgi:hypothetical protein
LPDRGYPDAGNVRPGTAGETERGSLQDSDYLHHGTWRHKNADASATFLAKPFDEEVLLESVRAALEN